MAIVIIVYIQFGSDEPSSISLELSHQRKQPAAVIRANLQVVSVIHTGTAGDTDVYTATVSVTERPYASRNPPAPFYRVPVCDIKLPHPTAR